MKPDQLSATAAVVCAARATVHAAPTIAGFTDPYAELLLPRVYKSRFARTVRRLAKSGAHIIGLRTVAIDEGVRTAPGLAQLVILGAGLDSRAWRMPELEDVDVFEVDHPSTQRYKRKRAASFPELAHHHYVSVDFETESLADRLAESGHSPERPSVWIWEGVTMYLGEDAIRATLETVADRSAPESRLLVTYLPPSRSRTLVGMGTGLLGEEFRACFTAPEMRALLAEYGLELVSDENGVDWHNRWALAGARLGRGFARTERMATAQTKT